MRIHRLVAASVSGILLTSVVASTAQAQTGGDKQYYVSVGDSYAMGYQPNGDLTHGYANQLVPKARKRGYDLTLVNYACGGATTTSILEQKGCRKDARPVGGPVYRKLTQTQAAAKFLRHHRKDSVLLTISIGGNDITACARASDPIACVAETVQSINANVTELAQRLRKAAGRKVLMVGLTYPDVLLGQWVREPVDQSIAELSVLAFQQFINPALKTAYASADGKFVDVTRATGAYGSLDRMTDFPPYGEIPVPVAKVCTLTWYCQKGDIHARTNGYGLMARLINLRLPRLVTPGLG
ncbi:MAG: GDSL-type esterase/lipase family protein [Candidatus Nanopelagicales bacterium]